MVCLNGIIASIHALKFKLQNCPYNNLENEVDNNEENNK